MQLSDRLNRLAPSATLAMSQKSAELKAQGIDIINLSVGEPDFNTPDHIKAAGQQAIADNWSRYSPVPGYLDLRQAICAKLERENGLHYEPTQIVVGNGAKQAVCNVLLSVVNPGDEVIIPAPYWVSYPDMVRLADGEPVFVEATIEQNFKITPQQLAAAITPRTKAIILCSPSNPTGSVYSLEELEGLAEVLRQHPEVLVIADEIYEHINYVGKHASIATLPDMQERTAIINGVSKAYAMTGWRLGYCCGPEEILAQMVKIHQFAIMAAPTMSQYAGTMALKNGASDVEMMRDSYNQRRRFLMAELKRLGIPCFEPFGAFYIFPNISQFGLSSEEFATRLIREHKVAVVPGSAFGQSGEGFVRVSYAYSIEELKQAFERIERYITELRAEQGGK